MKIVLGEDYKCGDTLVKRPNGFYYKDRLIKCDHFVARLDGDGELFTLDELKAYVLEQNRIYDDVEQDDFVLLENCIKCNAEINHANVLDEITTIINNMKHAS